jgi:hypothetical protein
MYLCVYVCMCMCTHTYTHTHTRLCCHIVGFCKSTRFVLTCMHACAYVLMCVYVIYVCVCLCINVFRFVCEIVDAENKYTRNTEMHKQTHTHTCICRYVLICVGEIVDAEDKHISETYTHTCIHAYMHTHTRIQWWSATRQICGFLTHTCIHIHIRTYSDGQQRDRFVAFWLIHAYTHIHTYAHTVMASDETDSRLCDARWRVIMDSDDEEDYEWLFRGARDSHLSSI